MHGGGAQIAPETASFAESDFAHEVTIRGNTVIAPFSGIQVFYVQNGNYLPGIWPNHHTILIVNNTITDAAYSPLLITSATDVTVTDNHVVNALCTAPAAGSQYGFIPKGALMFVENSVGVQFVRNTFTYTVPSCTIYGNYTTPIMLGKNVTDARVS